MHQNNQNDTDIIDLPILRCVICGTSLADSQIRRKSKTCSAKCAGKLSWKTYRKSVSDGSAKNIDRGKFLRDAWKQDDFRSMKMEYIKTDNPVYKSGVVQKANATKESKGILHTWMGVRGGNGRISECEQLIYDFCTLYGFEYNVAITTTEIRKKFPDEHYAFNYKPDFTNFKCKLCIEVDGDNHKSIQGRIRDAKKERCLSYLDYKFLRFSNDEIKEDINKVKRTIINKLIELGWCNNG